MSRARATGSRKRRGRVRAGARGERRSRDPAAPQRPQGSAPPPDMAVRRLLLIAAALAAAAAPAAAFYLPGLAPVNFCEAGKEKPECKVSSGSAEGRLLRPPGCGAARPGCCPPAAGAV